MRDIARRALLAVAAAMMLAGLGLSGVAAQAPDAEAEVRITARRLADGRTEFALQERAAGDSWGERRLPRARFFRASPAVGRWLSSSVLTIEVSALAAHSADGAESVEVRIVARRLADGRTEFALQERAAGDSWGERRLPGSRFFPASPVVGRWLSSSPLTVGAAGTAPAPAAAEPPTVPEITTIHVSPGDDIQIVIVGGARPPSCTHRSTEGGETTCLEWGLSAAERRDFVATEMANIASFFADRFGIAPPAGVTVLLDHGQAFVHQAYRGSIITSFSNRTSAALAANTLAHEYYHVLQYALTPHESLHLGVLGGPHMAGTPRWLVEGSATYVAALYDGTLADERRDKLLRYHGDPGTLRAETADDYDVGMLAVDWLEEHAGDGAHLQYWRELNSACRTVGECERPTAVTWADAFEAAFGLSPDAFYDRFEAYRLEAVRSVGIPHLADDVAEPVITTSGDVSDAIVAMAHDEIARLRWFYDRLGADPVDYTLVLADGESYPDAIRRLLGDRPEVWCSTWNTPPPAHRIGIVIDTSCDTAALAADGGLMTRIADFHLRLTVSGLATTGIGRSPYWLERGISAYASHHYEALAGRRTPRTVDHAAALRSTRTLGPLRDLHAWLDVRDHHSEVRRLGFLAAEWLADHAGETALLDFYRERHVSPSWQAAFEAAFGLTPDAFYAEFERYRTLAPE